MIKTSVELTQAKEQYETLENEKNELFKELQKTQRELAITTEKANLVNKNIYIYI